MLTVVFDGLAYGMLLFLMAVGLSITMGLMRFINLSHGVLAMVGAYCTLSLAVGPLGFIGALFLATLVSGAVGWLLEKILYRHFYTKPALDQVLVSLGVVFMAVAAFSYFYGSGMYSLSLPSWLQGQLHLYGVDIGVYRLFLLIVGSGVFIVLQLAFKYSRFGARVRAAVDHPVMTQALGVAVPTLFSLSFALGSALAGFGGALSLGMISVEPTFALQYLVFFLLVVCVGGAGTLSGPFVAALVIGLIDMLSKYYWPTLGAFTIYLVMIGLLVWRPQGVVRLSQKWTSQE